MEDSIKSLKEFVWDIIGYVIPGFLLIIVFNFILIPTIGIENNFLIDWGVFQNVLIIIVSYALGHIVYSLTLQKIKIQNFLIDNYSLPFLQKKIKSYHSKKWEEKFKTSSTIKSARSFLIDKEIKNIDTMEINELRNILMSRDPSMDQKVYTFMFRSSIFDHISTIIILTMITTLVQFIFSFFHIYFIKTNTTFKVIYLVLIPLIPILGNSKRMFYSIAQRLPFSNLK